AGHGAVAGHTGGARVADGGHGAHTGARAAQAPAAGAHAAHASHTHTPTLTGAARPLLVAAGVAAALGALVAVTSPLWVGTLLPDHHALGVALLTLGVASYTFQTTVCGLLSAAGRWSPFAVLITVDSGVRLVLALLAWAAGWHLVAFLVVTVAGAVTWLAVAAVSPSARSALHGVADVPTRDFLRRAGTAMLASGANSVIITGFPVLIKATTSLPDGTLAAVIFAVTLTRAPILVPLQRFQPVLIVRFATARGRVLRAAAAPMAAIVGVAVVGAVAAFLLGPWILRLFFTPEVWSPGWVLAWLTLAAASTALLMVTGSAALAAERHGLYLGGWVLATVVAVLLFRLDLSPELRAVLGLGLGPLAGVVLHLVLLRVTGDPAAGSGAEVRYMEDYDLWAHLLSRGARFANLPEPLTWFRMSRSTMRTSSPVNNPSVVMRRDAVVAAGGYGEVRYMEDYDLWAHLLSRGARFANLPEPLTWFRMSRST
ncbi:hypothetical protein MTQ16_01910, partial [Corynebacterium bovis]|uniref:hypothetical protein n=1 Tax=Corynebacterium bovis TaxID=36808 RepID=UPI003138CCB1